MMRAAGHPRSRITRSLALGATALTLAACSSTRVEGTWIHPDFAGSQLTGPVLVVDAMGDETARRLYEDAIAARLAARGVRAVKSYEALDGPLRADTPAPVIDAARAVGATYLLSSALIGHGRKTVVYSTPLSDVGVGAYQRGGGRYRAGGYAGWYSRSWAAATTTVRQVDIYAVETVLVDVASEEIEWTIRTKSAAGTSLAYDAEDFSVAIVDALTKARLLAPSE